MIKATMRALGYTKIQDAATWRLMWEAACSELGDKTVEIERLEYRVRELKMQLAQERSSAGRNQKSQTSKAVGANEFSDAEIKSLISLCHPDKHGGREVANEITKKLLAIKGRRSGKK